jgi:SAM-dependent methyltransferase
VRWIEGSVSDAAGGAMTGFEMVYRCAGPFLPPLYGRVRQRLIALARESGADRPQILDVGGRKSHYTIGVPGCITITELPRETDTQMRLNLGVTDPMIASMRRRRTNVDTIMLDDMTQSRLPSAAFDSVVAVEVLEHVDRDRAFLRNVHRVLKPGGTFLMTTPNGDSVPVPHNPDHKRHYTREALSDLLRELFDEVAVEYAIVAGRARTLGLRSLSPRHPIRAAGSMAANIVNAMQSSQADVCIRAIGTRHLIATARRDV